MLESLLIENFAIIDRLQIDFQKGMTVLTGETGAGKSIIIDAIGQLLGNRTQVDFIKTGTSKCFIEGVFNIENNIVLKKQLEELDFTYEDTLVVSKSFQIDGKTAVKINYRTVSQTILKRIMPLLVDIHSQFETHSLFDEHNHLLLLDSFIGEKIEVLWKRYSKLYQEYKDVSRKYLMATKEELSDEQLDFYQARVQEIEEIDIDNIDEEILEQEKKTLQNFEKTNERITTYQQFINGDRGALNALNNALKQLEYVNDLEEYQDSYNQLYDLYYSLMDVHETIMDTFHSVSFDEYRLQEVQDTLFKINSLKRKHGNSLQAIIEARKELLEKIEAFKNRDSFIQELYDRMVHLQQEATNLAATITVLRKEKAKEFSILIQKELIDLYLPKVQFEIAFTEKELSLDGKDKIVFMISTNVGQDVKPLNKVSSGGELSRIMLAIKVLSLQYSSISTIIFDEADSGVSGKVAESIGNKMKSIAKNKQVLCITHLSQVASFAKNHYLIKKTSQQKNTVVTIEKLDTEDSIIELAKMISGKEVSEDSIKHAKTLKQENSV